MVIHTLGVGVWVPCTYTIYSAPYKPRTRRITGFKYIVGRIYLYKYLAYVVQGIFSDVIITELTGVVCQAWVPLEIYPLYIAC